LRRMCRVANTLARVQKGILQKKMLEKDELSHYVYENKGNEDKVSDEKTDIYVDMTRLLHKKAAYDNKSRGLSAKTATGNCVQQESSVSYAAGHKRLQSARENGIAISSVGVANEST